LSQVGGGVCHKLAADALRTSPPAMHESEFLQVNRDLIPPTVSLPTYTPLLVERNGNTVSVCKAIDTKLHY
jgi:hypothetical protein